MNESNPVYLGQTLGELRARAGENQWKGAMMSWRGEVREFLGHGILLPEANVSSEWGHLYLCPRCQMRLEFNRAERHRHVCPSCGSAAEGEILDRCWITQCNSYQARNSLSAALLGVIDGDRAAIDYARDVLIGYAGAYRTAFEHGIAAGTGRVQPQALDESVWLLNICHAWRILSSCSLLSEGESRLICGELFLPEIDLLKRQTREVHNIHIWQAAAIASASLACGDVASLQFAERIISRGIERGVLPGGMWYEIAIGYHYYTLDALLCYEAACRESGRRGVAGEIIPPMLRAPLELALSSGQFPLINDGWPESGVLEKSGLYERAQALYGNCGDMLAWLVAGQGLERTGRDAFLSGAGRLDAPPFAPSPLSVTDGLICVRRPGITTVIKATPDGGGHDHPDRLSLNIYPEGSLLRAAEAGNPGYGSPYHEGFFRKTCAHNTVMIDGKEQRNFEPRISRIINLEEVAFVCTADHNGAYDNCDTVRRTVAGSGWVLDFCIVETDRARDLQWLFHSDGILMAEQGESPSGETAELIANGYMTGQRIIGDRQWSGYWDREGFRFHVSLVVEGDRGSIGCAASPGLPVSAARNCLIASCRDRRMLVTALFSLEGAALPRVTEAGPDRFACVLPSGRVLRGDGRRSVHVMPELT